MLVTASCGCLDNDASEVNKKFLAASCVAVVERPSNSYRLMKIILNIL